MKRNKLLLAIFCLISLTSFSQKENSLLSNDKIFKLSFFEKMKPSEKKNQLSLNDFFKYKPLEKSLVNKMPIIKPRGNFYMNLHKIDTTKHYSLKVFRPKGF